MVETPVRGESILVKWGLAKKQNLEISLLDLQGSVF